ncbi:hypothetical protein AL036_05680 [Salipiger aestuarii]|uniref:Uncharacterized protein n=1 Tax=Salipiger aestuarii TaxID=568098 RepID=A0A327YGQ6_9RHOB|nr:hypothetical protein [Salipiger aestuarii]EIE50834.1 hypothetical protein C357_11844 [Citreicella sp. 357]KAA8608899.1 hypothetical protein AL036_05680 [Salipiger aestuarii]KAA8613204.1 hypothetical protein AL037_05645 [Salipiger aestuarii]KAB2543044.1 hypothetical protein AL035_04110 [Salipiger aestuarii]RAK19691.1 hypothetical protein ATI53_100873 [Salipiger aestuarii]
MKDVEDRLIELEAGLIAHRRLLIRLLESLDPRTRDELLRWVADREVLRDGQEDPGAVPTGVEMLPLSIAEEFRKIAQTGRDRWGGDSAD